METTATYNGNFLEVSFNISGGPGDSATFDVLVHNLALDERFNFSIVGELEMMDFVDAINAVYLDYKGALK